MKNLELASFAFFYSTMFWQTHQRHISTDADDTKLSALPSLPTRAAVSRVHGNEGLMDVSLMLWLRFSWLVPPPMLSSWMRHAASWVMAWGVGWMLCGYHPNPNPPLGGDGWRHFHNVIKNQDGYRINFSPVLYGGGATITTRKAHKQQRFNLNIVKPSYQIRSTTMDEPFIATEKNSGEKQGHRICGCCCEYVPFPSAVPSCLIQVNFLTLFCLLYVCLNS
jgi:hypothetical protein